MKWLNSIAKAANNLLMVFAALIAAVLLVTGLYVLNDIYYTNAAAFVSYDLLKYRPVSKSSDDETIEYTFENLKQINSDTVGWIEMFGTNINYPVMQGSNNLEYLNKDIFGYHTFTGSIYLAAENDSEMGDWYNIIYGHHMENGAMFGDIEKYLDSDYFASHNEGILQTEKGDYHISVFACIRTNAYEDTVYQVKENAEEKYPALKDYIREHSVTESNVPELSDDLHILGMSTCSDAVTDGRIVLFASISPWNEATDGDAYERMSYNNHDEENISDIQSLSAVGHNLRKNKWAFLNLMCVLCTALTLLPIWTIKRKYGQLPYARKLIRTLDDENQELQENAQAEKNNETDMQPDEEDINNPQYDENNDIISDLKHFIRKCHVGIILEIIILIVSVIVFLLTEDLTGRMGIRDRWTGIMILISAAALITDFICLRYRGKLPQENPQNPDEPQEINNSEN